jgi:hypothetical protein
LGGWCSEQQHRNERGEDGGLGYEGAETEATAKPRAGISDHRLASYARPIVSALMTVSRPNGTLIPVADSIAQPQTIPDANAAGTGPAAKLGMSRSQQP